MSLVFASAQSVSFSFREITAGPPTSARPPFLVLHSLFVLHLPLTHIVGNDKLDGGNRLDLDEGNDANRVALDLDKPRSVIVINNARPIRSSTRHLRDRDKLPGSLPCSLAPSV